MPERATLQRARRARRRGEAPSTQAGEFVREEMHHIREGKHGARSAKQAIAIGLSKARRAGVSLPSRRGSPAPARRDQGLAMPKASNIRRSRGAMGALKKEGRQAASRDALARQARSSARRRGRADRSRAGRRAAATRRRAGG